MKQTPTEEWEKEFDEMWFANSTMMNWSGLIKGNDGFFDYLFGNAYSAEETEKWLKKDLAAFIKDFICTQIAQVQQELWEQCREAFAEGKAIDLLHLHDEGEWYRKKYKPQQINDRDIWYYCKGYVQAKQEIRQALEQLRPKEGK